MSWEKQDDECPGCRPALLSFETGKTLPDDDPLMVAILKVWAATTREEREAFHRFTCQNSRAGKDVLLVGIISKRMEEAARLTKVGGVLEQEDDPN
jgi:hypothetical protein